MYYQVYNTRCTDQVTNGLAETDGRLAIGDRILTVNGENMRNMTQEEAATCLKVCHVTLNSINP